MTATDLTSAPARAARSSSGWRLRVGVILAVLAVVAFIRFTVGAEWTEPIPPAALDGLTLSLAVLVESLPFIVLGIGVSVLVQVWLPAAWWDRLPESGLARRAALSLLGVLLPVCECGNVPLSRALLIRGLGPGDVITFLLAAPILNPVTIITTYQAFGFADGILVGRVLGAFVIANLVGWLFSLHPAPEHLLTERFARSCRTQPDQISASAGVAARGRRSVSVFGEELASLVPALVVGSLVAGIIQIGVPRDVLLGLGSNPVASVLALMALAFIVSICSTVDAFFILGFASMFLPGGIVAFLVFGAMVDIKMLALLRTTFSVQALVLLTSVVALGAAVLGLAVNLV